MAQEVKFTVGNVAFTNEGVQVIIPYSKDGTCFSRSTYTYDDLKYRMVAYCNRRMRKCARALNSNLASAKFVTEDLVGWDSGHFSVPTYKALKEFVDSRGNRSKFNPLILQQIIREFRCDYSIYESHLDPDIYKWYKESKNVDYDVFFDIMTDIMFASMSSDNFDSFMSMF